MTTENLNLLLGNTMFSGWPLVERADEELAALSSELDRRGAENRRLTAEVDRITAERACEQAERDKLQALLGKPTVKEESYRQQVESLRKTLDDMTGQRNEQIRRAERAETINRDCYADFEKHTCPKCDLVMWQPNTEYVDGTKAPCPECERLRLTAELAEVKRKNDGSWKDYSEWQERAVDAEKHERELEKIREAQSKRIEELEHAITLWRSTCNAFERDLAEARKKLDVSDASVFNLRTDNEFLLEQLRDANNAEHPQPASEQADPLAAQKRCYDSMVDKIEKQTVAQQPAARGWVNGVEVPVMPPEVTLYLNTPHTLGAYHSGSLEDAALRAVCREIWKMEEK